MKKPVSKVTPITAAKARPSRAELAAGIQNARSVVKAGLTDPSKDDGTLEMNKSYAGTITHVELSARTYKPVGAPRILVTFTADEGPSTVVPLDLPCEDALEGSAFGMSAEDEEFYSEVAADRLLRLARAIDHVGFTVHASIDKETSPWTFFDSEGNEMSAGDRMKAKQEIDAALAGITKRAKESDFEFFIGAKVVLTRRPNEKSPKYPYNNFSSVDSAE
jgi:hypothetical protein